MTTHPCALTHPIPTPQRSLTPHLSPPAGICDRPRLRGERAGQLHAARRPAVHDPARLGRHLHLGAPRPRDQGRLRVPRRRHGQRSVDRQGWVRWGRCVGFSLPRVFTSSSSSSRRRHGQRSVDRQGWVRWRRCVGSAVHEFPSSLRVPSSRPI